MDTVEAPIVLDALERLCSVDTDAPVLNYLKHLSLNFVPINQENTGQELYEALSPFFLSMKLTEGSINEFIEKVLLPYHQSMNDKKLKLSYQDENPLLVPLENPLVMSEMNWVYALREKSGLASFHTSESVSGASSVYAASNSHQQKLNLELLASSKGPATNFSMVDRDKLHKAEMKLKSKQERRENATAKKLGDVLNKPIQKHSASSSALDFDETTLLEPLERSRRNRDIRLEKFDISIGGKHIITDGQLVLPFGRRVGLIGRNGVGKSTLLRALSTRQLSVPKYVSILHVEQEVIGDDTPAIQSVLHADSIREALLKRDKLCNNKLNDASLSSSEKDIAAAELQKIYAKLEEMESDKAEARASLILSGLGFSQEAQTRATKTFSGGWRMRLALARALFCRPDLLLLDEPTNMLDIPAVTWLSNYLYSWTNTLLVVSHDREFLDEICTDVLHLHHETLDAYKGNYSQFIVTREERRKHYEKEYETNLTYRKHLQEFVDKWRYNAARAALAQSKLKILEKLPVLKPWPTDPPVVLKFPDVEKISPPLLQLDEVTFSYKDDLSDALLKNLNFSLQLNSRVAIVGSNGSGKTTFLKLMTGALQPKRGKVFIHGRLRFAFFSQHHVDQLDLSMNPLQFLGNKFAGLQEEEYRRHLGAFGLSAPLALQPIFTLSGGQKSRLVFATLSLTYPHVLILDEPTNHLDVDSIDALIQCLKEFQGGVIIVSHDTRFVEQSCNEILVCKDRTISKHDGTIREYVKSLPLDLPTL